MRGYISVSIDKELSTLPPHSLVVIKPGQHHRFLYRTEGAECYRILFPRSDPPVHLIDDMMNLSNIYMIPGTRVAEEFIRLDMYYHDIRPTQVLNVLVHTLGIIMNYTCNIVGMRAVPTEEASRSIIEYIKRHITSIHRVEDITVNVHMSPSYVHKIVMKETGMPVMTYVRTQQCLLAAQLLKKGNPAGMVSAQLGFQNYSTFYRVWKKYSGKSPSTGIEVTGEGRV